MERVSEEWKHVIIVPLHKKVKQLYVAIIDLRTVYSSYFMHIKFWLKSSKRSYTQEKKRYCMKNMSDSYMKEAPLSK